MNWLLHLTGCVAAFVLIAAAFVYPFAPKRALALLKNLAITALFLLLLVPALGQLVSNHPLASIVALLGLSTAAYFVRESRLRSQEWPTRPWIAERRPSLPRWEDDE